MCIDISNIKRENTRKMISNFSVIRNKINELNNAIINDRTNNDGIALGCFEENAKIVFDDPTILDVCAILASTIKKLIFPYSSTDMRDAKNNQKDPEIDKPIISVKPITANPFKEIIKFFMLLKKSVIICSN